MMMTMTQMMGRNLIVVAAMVLAMPAFSGEILPYRGGAQSIGCDGGGGMLSSNSQGLGCDPETWSYWMPIGEASGSVTLVGNVLHVEGQICTAHECIGLGDRMVIMSSNGQTADVIMDGGQRATITLLFKDSGVVHVGTGSYLVHTSGLQ